MTERLTRTSVEFLHPFELTGVAGVQPPGKYDIDTVEEPLDSMKLVGYRRVSTTIILTVAGFGAGARQATEIDPADLASALQRDAKVSDDKSQI